MNQHHNYESSITNKDTQLASNSTNNSTSLDIEPDLHTSTTTASFNNRNSIFLQDQDAYIAIHHHHINTQDYKNSLSSIRKAKVLKSESETIIGDSQSRASRVMYDSGYGNGLVIPVNHLLAFSSRSEIWAADRNEPNFYDVKNSTI